MPPLPVGAPPTMLPEHSRRLLPRLVGDALTGCYNVLTSTPNRPRNRRLVQTRTAGWILRDGGQSLTTEMTARRTICGSCAGILQCP